MAVHAIERATGSRPSTLGGFGTTFHDWAATYQNRHADIGTGDGRFALDLARRSPHTAVIAIDANLDRLRGSRRRDPENLRFIAANALDEQLASLPMVDVVTINFPYGSLLRGLVECDPALLGWLDALLAPGGRIEARVNATALTASGLDPSDAPAAIASTLRQIDGVGARTHPLTRTSLRTFPSSWAKRLGHGREQEAWLIVGRR